MEKRDENFGNVASISQTHLFHKLYIHISLSAHTPEDIAKPVAFYWFVTIAWSFKLHFQEFFKVKKVKNARNFGKKEPIYPTTTFHKIYIDISLCMGYILLASYLFLVWSYSFKLYAIHQQFWKYLKDVQNYMDQHNFEMICIKCTIPAIQCIILVLLCYVHQSFDFGI